MMLIMMNVGGCGNAIIRGNRSANANAVGGIIHSLVIEVMECVIYSDPPMKWMNG
jgi:hypothetical protein